jgi:uncharacterized protein YecA (UPF0149 family)
MTTPFARLSEDEFHKLDQFLLYDVNTEEVMTLDMVDGFLHALAVGPTTTHPKRWLPEIWGTKETMPPMDSIEQMNHILGLVMRHFNSIIAGLEGQLAQPVALELAADGGRRAPEHAGHGPHARTLLMQDRQRHPVLGFKLLVPARSFMCTP